MLERFGIHVSPNSTTIHVNNLLLGIDFDSVDVLAEIDD
jgi:hypothetical protein